MEFIIGRSKAAIPTEGHLEVINESFSSQKSEVDIHEGVMNIQPETSFKNQLWYQQHDPRLQLATDTYVQLVLGAGLTIKVDNEKAQKVIDDWIEEYNFEEKLEEGLPSYIGAGNLMFEHEKNFKGIEEVDLKTIEGVGRKKNGDITEYNQDVNFKENILKPDTIVHLRLTGAGREVWGRGLFFSLVTIKELPVDGTIIPPTIESQMLIEDAMKRIFQNLATPIMMIWFKDAGEKFIEETKKDFKKVKPGARIITDKEFEVKIFEVDARGKMDSYIEHLQKNNIEPGIQFPMGFFNADFTARAASETSDNTVIRKVKRIQKRLSRQLRDKIFLEVIRAKGIKIKAKELIVMFEFETKNEITPQDVTGWFEKGVIRRSEFRKYIDKKTPFEIDRKDMEDTPPVTSVTPTNDMRTSQPSDAAQGDKEEPKDEPDTAQKISREMEALREMIKTKIPKPRGRPKNTSNSSTNREDIMI